MNFVMHLFDERSFLSQYMTLFLVITIFVLYIIIKFKSLFNANKYIAAPPSPLSLPIVGHLHLLAKYPTNPWLGFNEIRKKYGDVVSLALGQCKTVMVSSPDAIREVLLVKGDVFCDRPSFYRHTLIFGGDKHNSLALCDWSELQKIRRSMAQYGIIPRFNSFRYKKLVNCINVEVSQMISELKNTKQCFLAKDNVLSMCANVFLSFLCSTRIEKHNQEFIDAISKYDHIFYEINQCYLIDFMPWLSYSGLYKSHFRQLRECADLLREYLESEFVNPRFERIVESYKTRKETSEKSSEDVHKSFEEDCDKDFLDYVLEHYINNPITMNWTVSMFEIEDLIGGHSAVGNLLMRLIGHLAVNDSVQQDMYEEAVNAMQKYSNNKDMVTLELRPYMPLTDASIFETLRLASSPIVPHVASKDTVLQGYHISKGTMILFNSYHLNLSHKYWLSPEKFNPSRFLSNDGLQTHMTKPDHFFPFSTGRRACLGYKMVTTITFTAVANLLLNYKITAENNDQHSQINQQLAPIGSLALSADNCFKVTLIPRTVVN